MRVGWIGTGVMGAPMCGHVLEAGYSVSVHTRTRAKAKSLESQGAAWCDTPRSVAAQSDVVFTIVGYPVDVEAVVLGADGVLAGMRPGGMLVDMTTSEPSLAMRMASRAADKDIAALDAPVSGGDRGAREGTLTIMVGGPEDAFDRALPLLHCFGKPVRRMGEAGAGQHTKMSNQILIASTMIGVVESLMYAMRAGLDLDRVIDVIGSGAAASWSINHLGRRIIRADYDPGFFIKHFVKDMGIALAEAGRMRLALPGLALAQQFYIAAMAEGLEGLGTQGLYRVYERMNGLAVD